MNHLWVFEFCLRLVCSFMYLLEQENAIQRFLAILVWVILHIDSTSMLIS